MISRRALFGTGAAVIVVAGAGILADSAHRLDDFARSVGLKPRPRPAVSDDLLIRSVAQQQNILLGTVEAVAARHPALARKLRPYAEIAQAQVRAVGGSGKVPGTLTVDGDVRRAVASLSTAYAAGAKARAKDANRAVSPDLARVLSSMSAGLAQCAHAVRDIA